ncbi:MAG: hypothetical protein ACLP01_29400 [Solirubrobacteraceae bacterium]
MVELGAEPDPLRVPRCLPPEPPADADAINNPAQHRKLFVALEQALHRARRARS